MNITQYLNSKNVLVTKELPPFVVVNGKRLVLAEFIHDVKAITHMKSELRIRKIMFRTVKYRHPDEKIVGVLFYIEA